MRKKPEETMDKFRGQIYWRSRDGRYVVVRGPFPKGLVRTTDSESIESAIKKKPDSGDHGLYARGATTRAYYAKMHIKGVESTYNDLGEVSP